MSARILHSVRVAAAPGHAIYRLLSPAVDIDGVEWPAGTEYTPGALGRDNERGCDYARVAINGRPVRFEVQS